MTQTAKTFCSAARSLITLHIGICLTIASSQSLSAGAQNLNGDATTAAAPTTKSSTATINPNGGSQAPPSKIKLYGQVNELLSACANAGVEIPSTTLPARIHKVRLGSPAFYAGLQDNDVILRGSLDNNRLKLTFRRGPSLYAVDLATEGGSGPIATTQRTTAPALTLSTGTQTGPIKPTNDPAWRKLETYDIVMFIDQSGSMNDAINNSGLTKWDWCASQLSTFASQALANTGRRFTIVTFNGQHSLRRDCSPAEVEQTFLTNRPGGPTDLSTPLHLVLDDYMSGVRRNPLLLVVLTDGEPARPDFVEQEIVDATKKMTSPEQIKIVFFEIGNDVDGAALIRLLDVGLTRMGARYDIVDANTFDRLQQVGLKAALYDTFNHNFQTSLRFSPTPNLQTELEAVRKQLEAAKARNAQSPSSR